MVKVKLGNRGATFINGGFVEEIWKEIVDEKIIVGKYEVSNKGRVRGVKTGYIIPIQDNGFGYKKCAFSSPGQTIQRYIHRLVANAFLENPNEFPQVGHKDHDKENNSVENLYWTSQSQNTRDGIAAGRINSKKRGKTNKFSHSDIKFIAEKRVQGYGVAEIARLLDVPRTSVSSVLNRRSNHALFVAYTNEAMSVEVERQ